MTDKGQNKKEWSGTTYELATKRMQRFAMILEHLISPEGSFPVFGRSIT